MASNNRALSLRRVLSRGLSRHRSSRSRSTNPSRPPRFLNEAGVDLSISTIILIILGLIVLTVITLIFIIPAKTASDMAQNARLFTQIRQCVQEKNLPDTFCAPTEKDKDGDCLIDTCDSCIDPSKPPAAGGDAGMKSRQLAGSNLFDFDDDGVPDLCDDHPQTKKLGTCKLNDQGHCPIPKTYYNEQGKPFTLASLTSKEGSPKDIYEKV